MSTEDVTSIKVHLRHTGIEGFSKVGVMKQNSDALPQPFQIFQFHQAPFRILKPRDFF